MPTDRRADKAAEIRCLNDHAIFVSCRLEDYTGTLNLEWDDKLTLEPLTPHGIWTALHKWAPDEQAEQVFWELAGLSRRSD